MDLRKLRKEKGWSQADLSGFSGLSVKTIHRIENGHVTSAVETAKALAAVFDLPFADFLPPAKESSPSGQQTSRAKPTPESSTTFAISWRRWVPYIAASFVAVSAYLINDLYSQIGQLSEDYSELAVDQAQTPDSNVNLFEIYDQTRTGMVAAIDEFNSYYGDQPILSLLGVPEDVTSENASVTFIEVSTLLLIARILSKSEGEPQRNSDIAVEMILDDFLSCYASERQPITVQFENGNIDNMFSCIDEIASTNGWVLADQQSDALNRLSLSVKDFDSGFLRRLLGGHN